MSCDARKRGREGMKEGERERNPLSSRLTSQSRAVSSLLVLLHETTTRPGPVKVDGAWSGQVVREEERTMDEATRMREGCGRSLCPPSIGVDGLVASDLVLLSSWSRLRAWTKLLTLCLSPSTFTNCRSNRYNRPSCVSFIDCAFGLYVTSSPISFRRSSRTVRRLTPTTWHLHTDAPHASGPLP
jgi:hypothetical protein